MTYPSQSFKPLPVHVEPAHTREQILAGYALALLGAVLFSGKAIFIKLAYRADPNLAPLTLLAIRMGIAMPIYAAIGVWAYKRRFHNRSSALGFSGVALAGGIGLFGYYFASLMDFS
ncbi:MAG TPA: EamA/RhaT family transporter, partial [Hellea balneolensis]|nr:EamA/RhaT family transporter [Hellea balneolensis]